jgi:hypothetical protein
MFLAMGKYCLETRRKPLWEKKEETTELHKQWENMIWTTGVSLYFKTKRMRRQNCTSTLGPREGQFNCTRFQCKQEKVTCTRSPCKHDVNMDTKATCCCCCCQRYFSRSWAASSTVQTKYPEKRYILLNLVAMCLHSRWEPNDIM